MKPGFISIVSCFALPLLLAPAAAAQDEPLDIYSAFDPPAAEKPDSDSETVADAIAAALSHDPQIALAMSRRAAAKADRFQAFGGFLPDIEASATYGDANLRSDNLHMLTNRDGTTVGLTASQPVFQGFSALNRYREAKNRYSQTDFALDAARQQTALNAARAHADVLLARETVDHRIDNLTLVHKQYEVADRRMKAGAESRTGVEQARMRVAQAQVDLGQARAVLAQTEAAYERVVGHYPPPSLTGDDQDFGTDFSTLEAAQSTALANNPSIAAGRAAVAAAKNAKNAAKGDFSPKLSVEGTYYKRYGASDLTPSNDEEYQLLARMSMPIFNQGRTIAGLQSKDAGVNEQNAQLANTRLAVAETIARSWRQLSDAKVRRQAAANAIAAAELSVKGLQLEYEAGRRTVINVLNGQRDLVTARISLSQAEHDYRVSQYELATASGLILALAGEEPETAAAPK